MGFRRDAPIRNPSRVDRHTPWLPQREDRSVAKPSTFKGNVIEGGSRREVKCYLCDGPHLIIDCPKKKSFNVMGFEDEKEKRDKVRLGSMRLLNSVEKEETQTNKGGGFMFMKVKANN